MWTRESDANSSQSPRPHASAEAETVNDARNKKAAKSSPPNKLSGLFARVFSKRFNVQIRLRTLVVPAKAVAYLHHFSPFGIMPSSGNGGSSFSGRGRIRRKLWFCATAAVLCLVTHILYSVVHVNNAWWSGERSRRVFAVIGDGLPPEAAFSATTAATTRAPKTYAYHLYQQFFRAKGGDDPRYEGYKWNLYMLLKRTEWERQRGKNRTGSEYPKSLIGNLVFGSQKDLLCELKKNPPFQLTNSTPPFDRNPLRDLLPSDKRVLPGKRWGKCALVSSSGCLVNSSLGSYIDSFDQVMRLNSAPVEGYENDVGSKTTIRSLNNYEMWALARDIASRQKYYQKTINYADTKNALLISWDACPHRGPYDESCIENVDNENITKKDVRDPIGSFFKWRKSNPDREFYYIDPSWIWSLGDFLQKLAVVHIRTLVPSSGFFGFAFLMHYCKEVHLFEMLPSMQKDPNEKIGCRYYRSRNLAPATECSLFRGHLRQQELLAVMRMNTASDEETYGRGHAIVPGLIDLEC